MSLKITLRPNDKNIQGDRYKDINCSDLLNRSSLKDLASIKNRIENMFTWSQGSRILLPEFGNILERIKYEPLNEITLKNAKSSIQQMFSYDSDIKLIDVVLEPNHDKNELYIRVDYSVPSLDVKTSTNLTVDILGE